MRIAIHCLTDRESWKANILISSNGTACIADFGLSTVEGSNNEQHLLISTSFSRPAGTFRWLAPELMVPDSESDNAARSYRNTRASDIYALGMVAYEVYRSIPRPHHI